LADNHQGSPEGEPEIITRKILRTCPPSESLTAASPEAKSSGVSSGTGSVGDDITYDVKI
jgi:hypothetical protein